MTIAQIIEAERQEAAESRPFIIYVTALMRRGRGLAPARRAPRTFLDMLIAIAEGRA